MPPSGTFFQIGALAADSDAADTDGALALAVREARLAALAAAEADAAAAAGRAGGAPPARGVGLEGGGGGAGLGVGGGPMPLASDPSDSFVAALLGCTDPAACKEAFFKAVPSLQYCMRTVARADEREFGEVEAGRVAAQIALAWQAVLDAAGVRGSAGRLGSCATPHRHVASRA
jgi:hypothetical protein